MARVINDAGWASTLGSWFGSIVDLGKEFLGIDLKSDVPESPPVETPDLGVDGGGNLQGTDGGGNAQDTSGGGNSQPVAVDTTNDQGNDSESDANVGTGQHGSSSTNVVPIMTSENAATATGGAGGQATATGTGGQSSSTSGGGQATATSGSVYAEVTPVITVDVPQAAPVSKWPLTVGVIAVAAAVVGAVALRGRTHD